MSPFGLKFSQMNLRTETSKLMYIWSFFFVVLHKPTLLPSTFNIYFLPQFSFLPGNATVCDPLATLCAEDTIGKMGKLN